MGKSGKREITCGGSRMHVYSLGAQNIKKVSGPKNKVYCARHPPGVDHEQEGPDSRPELGDRIPLPSKRKSLFLHRCQNRQSSLLLEVHQGPLRLCPLCQEIPTSSRLWSCSLRLYLGLDNPEIPPWDMQIRLRE
ncbi:unnamed protein product [Prunus armeniaca]